MTAATEIYSAYGAHPGEQGIARTAYTGEVGEADTGCYLLGERLYSPALRRFLAADQASPFDSGGVNRYAYCSGDPVNRIDPSGHTWLAWLGASQGWTGNAGASRSVSPASRPVHETASSPTSIASAAAAMTDTVSVMAAIDSVALIAADQTKANGLYGRVGMGSPAPGGSALPPARNGAPTGRFLGGNPAVVRPGGAGTRPRRNVHVVTDPNIPANRLTTNRFGTPTLVRQWIYGLHHRNPNSSIWAPDTEINGKDFDKLFTTLSNVGAKKVTVYTGAHGEPYGRNWHLRTAERLDAEPRFFLEDLVHSRKAASAVGATMTPVNMALLTKQEMQHHLLKDGVHIIGSCFGLSDEVVMEALNVQQVTVYDLV